MKKPIIIPFIFLFTLCACSAAADAADSRAPVIINIPSSSESTASEQTDSNSEASHESTKATSDNTYSSEALVSADSAEAAASDTNTATDYCGNKNTKVFHKSTCGSVSRMKEENKEFFSDRAAYISNGYTPCKRCKP